LRSKSILVICIVILSLFIMIALFAPWMGNSAVASIDLKNRLLPPSHLHWLGTDELGRDVWTRLAYGARISLLVSFIVVTIASVIGFLLGAAAAFGGRWADELIMRAADLFLAFPGLLLAIAFMAVLGPSLKNVILALVIIAWIPYARLSRALILKFRELEFVQAARSLGANSGRILLQHLLPNMLPALLVQISFSFAGMILSESSLSFLGLGVQPPTPSWGNMLSDAKNHLLEAPYLTLFPGLCIFLTVLCLNLLGDAVQKDL
jgi:peptide/nickel transport system permease protein